MGAMNFGERGDMLKLAAERLAAVQKEFPKAALLNQDDVSVIYLVADEPANTISSPWRTPLPAS